VPNNAVTLDILRAWLKVLEDTIWRMRVDQHIFRTLFAIIDGNPELQSRQSHLYLWMYDNYVERMAMGVRRLRDPRKGTISLTKFLRRLSGNPMVISRAFYFTHFPADYPRIPRATKEEKEFLRNHFINGEYDRLVCEGWNQPTAGQLENEIAWLDTFGAPVVEYATKRIAHHDEDPPLAFASLDDIDVFIEYSEELFRKYNVLVNATTTNLDAHINYDWLAPLRIPWIPKDRRQKNASLDTNKP
jgi:hypothetical protein